MKFPQDEGDHSEADFEWWYFNGHAWSDDGSRYGLMVCFLRHLVYIMVLDVKRGRCLARVVRNGETKRSTKRLDLSHAGNWWRQVQGRAFAYEMLVKHDGIGLRLEMESLKPPLVLGKLPLGLLGFVYYYALTRVAINGELSLRDLTCRVSGSGWIDRMWGRCEWTALDGWQWFSIMLKDNVEVVVFRGFHPLTGRVHSQFLVMTTPKEVVRTERFQVDSFHPWASPSSGIVYSLGWRIRAKPDIHLQVCPACPNQELRKGMWEGECAVEGTINGSRIDGYAYVELLHSYTVHVGLLRRVLYLFLSSARFAIRTFIPQQQMELLVRQIKRFTPNVLMPQRMSEY